LEIHEFPSNRAKFLWIHGPPGFRKSVLCTTIVNALSAVPGFPLAYFFCSSEGEDLWDPFAIVRFWVWQAVRQSDAALNLAYDFLTAKEGLSTSRTNVWDLLESIARCHPNFTFVVDGLDECHRPAMEWKNGRSKSREDFLKKLKETLSHTNSRVLIVSRDVGDIRPQLCDYVPQVEEPAIYELSISKNDVRNDVIRFSEHIIHERLPKTDKVLQERLAMKMADRSDGMFLWIRLQKDQLRGSKNLTN
jgi:hypothetical protein